MTSISGKVGIAAYVRTTLKFDPQDSVALVLMQGTSALATLRADLKGSGNAIGWAGAIGDIVRTISAEDVVDGIALVAYDDAGAFTEAKYDALAEELRGLDAPVHQTVLVANGMISDYPADASDAVPYSEILTEEIALEGMLNGGNPLRAKDIEHCEETCAEVQMIAEARTAEMIGYGVSIEVIAPKISHEMVSQIVIYREAGEVTEEVAGWLAGTFAVKLGRDLAVSALAGTATDTASIADYLIGDRVVEDRRILEDGHEMLFESLGHIAGTARINILCAIAWAHWTRGNGTEAMATLTLALDLDRDHELANLFTKVLSSGKVARTALKKPQQ